MGGENSKNSKQEESEGRSSKTTTRNERPKETREQCNAVKALLFNVDGQAAQSSTRETSVSGRTSKERATATNADSKGNEKKGKRVSVGNRKKHQNGTVIDAEKSHVNKAGKGRSSSVTASKKSTASSPAIIIDAPQDPHLTDLSSEG